MNAQPIMFAISDVIWQAIIAGVVTIVLSIMSNRTKTAVQSSSDVAVEKLDGIAKTGEKTHTLVNSNMGAQLKLGAELARWKADREPTQQNKDAADLAEQRLKEHEGKQAIVDRTT